MLPHNPLDRASVIELMTETLGELSSEFRDAIWEATQRGLREQPTLSVAPDVWTASLCRALTDVPEREAPDRLAAIRAGELLFATALAAGEETAMNLFERAWMPGLDRALRRFAPDDDALMELRQQVRVRLFVAEEGRTPKIGEYQGRGSLQGWLRVVAGRVAINARRSVKHHAPLQEVPEQALQHTAEFLRLRQEHRELFVKVLREAFLALPARSRTLLRFRYADGMAAVALARAYAVHESTMSRRLASARAAMADNFARLVAEALGTRSAVPDLLEVMQSQIDASLRSLFATKHPGS